MKNTTWVIIFQNHDKFWIITLGNYIKHKPLISEEWILSWAEKGTCTSHALKKGVRYTKLCIITPTPSFFQIKEWHLFKKGWGSTVQSSHCLSPLYECLVFQFTHWPTVCTAESAQKSAILWKLELASKGKIQHIWNILEDKCTK